MANKTDNKKNIKQAVRFCIVGLFNTIVDYGIFYILISIAGLHKSIAQVFSTAVAMCGSYLINRYWTFGKSGHGNAIEITKFVIINIVSMLTVMVFTHLFYDILHIENVANSALVILNINLYIQGDGAVMLCKAAASLFSIIVNFLGNKLWVFKDK